MAQIAITDLTFGYDGSADNVVENLNLSLDTSWRLGLTGRNGRGKTTLLRLLCGREHGRGRIDAPVRFVNFPLDIPDRSLPLLEALRAATDAADWQLERELGRLGIAGELLARPVGRLSGGERTRALLAALFAAEDAFPLIDEPTDHLDAEARKRVGDYLASKRGFMLVSHDRALLDRSVDHILAFNRTGVELQRGNFSSWYENKRLRDEFEAAENVRLKRDIDRLEAAAARAERWSDAAERRKIGFDPTKTEKSLDRRAYEGEKSRRMMKRSKTYAARQERLAEEKRGLLKDVEETEKLFLRPLDYPKETLLEFKDCALGYDGCPAVCGGISLTVRRGDRVALQGGNGSGKTTLFRYILGEEGIYLRGEYRIGGGLKISYVQQDASQLTGTLEALALARGADRSLYFALLRKLGFERAQFEKPLEAFSEGQKKKALLAASLCERAHLYLWDEPLNYIDVFSRIQIERLLINSGATVLFSEHDAAFCANVASSEHVLGAARGSL